MYPVYKTSKISLNNAPHFRFANSSLY